MNSKVKALVLTGFGINCDYETAYALRAVGATAEPIHVNRLIDLGRSARGLAEYQILVVDGGFSWADDHGAGMLLGLKLRAHLGSRLEEFLGAGKLIAGICNGFQALVNMGLLPGLPDGPRERSVALAANDCGNYRDQWVHLTVDPATKCLFTRGLTSIDLPIRHGEGKFYAPPAVIARLQTAGQVVMRYAKPTREDNAALDQRELVPAGGEFPFNPNGSLDDIAGICDATGRVFGLMPHPDGFNHLTNHPNWTRYVDQARRGRGPEPAWEGRGLAIFRNAVEYAANHLL